MCDVCHDHHNKIQAAIEGVQGDVTQLRRDLEHHIGETHAHLVNSHDIKEWDRVTMEAVLELQESHGKLAAAVMGPLKESFDGDLTRDVEASLISQVSQNTRLLTKHTTLLEGIDHQVHNGLKFKLSVQDKALLIALLTLMTTVIQVW